MPAASASTAHVPKDLHDFVARQRLGREGCAGTIASWLVADHDGRPRPGGDAGQAQGAGKAGWDAAGHKAEKS